MMFKSNIQQLKDGKQIELVELAAGILNLSVTSSQFTCNVDVKTALISSRLSFF